MKKANGILVFGILFIILSIIYTSMNIYVKVPNDSQEIIMIRERKTAFILTTFWSGIIMIGISIFLRTKAKKNNN